jgi:large subunit ribosomal protein L4e
LHQAAFEKLDSVFGSYSSKSDVKKTFVLPRASMFNADLARIINSDEVQSKVRVAKAGFAKPSQKRNPLINLGAMLKLNPYVAQVKRAEKAMQAAAESKKKRLAPKVKPGVAKKARAAKAVNAKKFSETLRATPQTPAAAFLDSYNAVEEVNTMAKNQK